MQINLDKTSGVKVSTFFKCEQSDSALYKYVTEKELFSKKFKEVYTYLPYDNEDKKEIYLGLGCSKKITVDKFRELGFVLANTMVANKEYEVFIEMPIAKNLTITETTKAFVEGLYHATYKFDKYLSDKKEFPNLVVNIKADVSKEIIEEAKDIMDAVFLTRDLVNDRAYELYPEVLANIAKEELEKVGVEVLVYDEKQCEEMGLKAFLAVGRGSDKKPRFVVMKYLNNPDSKEVLGLVGKGITYDTGGYCMKPSAGMDTMNCDMTGAATVMSTIKLVAKRKLKTNVIAVAALCENAISGDSYKPGDVVGSLSGKTIEIDNTDAEGRVTLADSMFYATDVLKVTKVVDVATLTGACMIALSEYYTGVVSNNSEFYKEFEEAANKAGENVWLLPSDDRFREQNKSSVADIKNTGGRLGGAITAGLFIEEFVANNIPWIHLDVAGTAYLSKPSKYLPKNATGVHVQSLYNLIKEK